MFEIKTGYHVSDYKYRYEDTSLFILVYSIDRLRSFEHIKEEFNNVYRYNILDRFDIILVGNKCDLSDSERKVSYKMGKDLANEWNVPFIETSSKTGENITKAIELLIREKWNKFRFLSSYLI